MFFELLNDTPRIILYHDVLTASECDYVIANADNFQKSMGYDFETKQSKPTEWRTSSNHFDFNRKFQFITEKSAELSGYSFSNIEDVQILRYEPGEFYKPHNDYFNFPPEIVSTDNDRIATIIFYLNDNFTCGATEFPMLNINVKPRTGSALFFDYKYTPEINKLTLHGGMSVDSGIKYVATSWIRSSVWRNVDGP
jgi:prolyl 4-hydroxylase